MTALRPPDARLLIGIGLVVASVIGIAGLVAAVDHRVPAYAAVETLEPGARLEVERLVERQVSLDGAEDRYLLVGQLPAEGLVVTRPIREGELISLAALGDPAGVDATAIVVAPATAVSGTVVPGALVDLWASEPSSEGRLAAPPRVLVADAVVIDVLVESGFAANGRAASVELLVPRARLAAVLQAVADRGELSVVPAGIPWAAR